MRRAVAFTGPSDSGKTTLIEKVARRLISTYKISIIKNDPKDKASFDVEGKDSYKFSMTGADVVVTSPNRTTYFYKKQHSLQDIIKRLDFDYLLVEGMKYLPLPRIAIFRNGVDESYFRYIKAVAIDDSVDKSLIPEGIDILNLNDIDEIIDWILKNSEEIKD